MTLTVLVYATAVAYRLSTFVTTDSITRPWRVALAKRHPPTDAGAHWLVELANCGRCVGWWVSGLVVGTFTACGWLRGWRIFAVAWVAVSGAVTFLVSAAP